MTTHCTCEVHSPTEPGSTRCNYPHDEIEDLYAEILDSEAFIKEYLCEHPTDEKQRYCPPGRWLNNQVRKLVHWTGGSELDALKTFRSQFVGD